MKVGQINGRNVTYDGPLDAAQNGTSMLATAPRFIMVTASNTYRIYTTATKYRTVYLYKGIEYDGPSTYCITDSSGTALTAGIAYYVY